MSEHFPQIPPNDELQSLIDKLADETISPVELVELEDRLRHQPAAQDFYLAYCELQARLCWLARGAEAGPLDAHQLEAAFGSLPANVPAPPSRPVVVSLPANPASRSPVLGFVLRTAAAILPPAAWAVAATAMAFTAYAVFISWGMLEKRDARHEARRARFEEAASGQQVATITGSADATWRQQPQAGSPAASAANQPAIAKGEPLQIASGRVALQLRQGTQLTLEGPAKWSVVDDNRVKLQSGKLVAKVPRQAIGFTVETPTSQIVDLGTEFGVTVDLHGQTDAHVFKGEIEVQRSAANASRLAPAPAGRSHRLTAGQAVRIDASGVIIPIVPVAATAAQFIRPPVATAKDEINPDVLSPYARYVIDETKPVAYWDFSWYRNSMKIANDRITGCAFDHFAPEHVGMLGPAASQGFAGFGETNPAIAQRWDAAQPAGLRSRQPQLATGDYSMALWVQPTSVTSQPVYYLLGKGDATSSRADGVCDSVLLSGTVRPEMTGKLRYYDGTDKPLPTGKSVLTPGKWHSVVLVRQADKVFVYLNGVLEIDAAARQDGRRRDTFTFGQRPDMQADLAFSGQLDETALWDRALTPREVSEIYQRAIHAPNPKP